jgi:two-component system cell cycle response regulator
MAEPHSPNPVLSEVHGDLIVGASFESTTPLRRLRRWWKERMSLRLEDEMLDRTGGSGPSRLVAPILTPVLAVAALVLYREPDNQVAFQCLVLGATALIYTLVAEAVARRVNQVFWLQLANSAAYTVLISLMMYIFLTSEHPREHLHWVIFFLYFLLIGSLGLSDDPRQAVCTGGFSIIGYGCVVIAMRAAVDAGVPMAVRLSSEYEWVANSAKIGLLAGTTVVAAASAARGRALRRMSLRDGLTGMLNRHAFDRCLEHLAVRAAEEDTQLTIAMIDIDHFKKLNDTFGHATGDRVLNWVATRIDSSFRATDLVARYGGEEFVVALLDTTDDTVFERLQVLRAHIATSALRERRSDAAGGTGREIRTSVSIGVAQFPNDGLSVTDVLARADARLYAAKDAGRNRIVKSDD